MPISVFSVEYKDSDHTDNLCSVDWRGRERGGWVPVWKSTTGSEWYPEKYLSEIAYEAILGKFHLVKLSSELTMEKVRLMSPAELMKFRVAKGLPRIDVFNDIGDPKVRAEEYK